MIREKDQMPDILNNINLKKLVSVLEHIMHEAIKDLNKIDINNNDLLFQFKAWLKLFMFKATCSCNATLVILQHDPYLYPETHALARLLLELFINIKYMYVKDPVNLSMRFYEYRRVWQYRYKESICRMGPRQRQRYNGHVDSDKLKKDYRAYLEKYGNNKANKNYWSGKPLEQMAIDIDESWLYNQVYRLQCSYTHPQSVSMVSDFQIKNNDIIIKRSIDPEKIDRILGTCISLFGQLYMICSDVFNLNKSSWIEDLAAELIVLNDRTKIEQLINEKKCPYCGESTIKKFDECKRINIGQSSLFEEYYVFGCQHDDCVQKFYIPKTMYDDLQSS